MCKANRRITQRTYAARHNRHTLDGAIFMECPELAGPWRQNADWWLHPEGPGAAWWLCFSPALVLLPPFPPSGTLCPSRQWFSSVYDWAASSRLLLLLSATAPPSAINLGLQYGPFSSFHSTSPESLIEVQWFFPTSKAPSPTLPSSPKTEAWVSASSWGPPWNSRVGPGEAPSAPSPDKLAAPSDFPCLCPRDGRFLREQHWVFMSMVTIDSGREAHWN